MKPLTSNELLILEAEIVTDTIGEAVEYINKYGYKIKKRAYSTQKKKIHENDTQRLYDLAKAGKESQMQRIDEFKIIKKKQWEIFRNSPDDNIKLRALKQIKEIEPFISAAEAAVPHIIKEVIQNFGKPGDTKKQEHVESITRS